MKPGATTADDPLVATSRQDLLRQNAALHAELQRWRDLVEQQLRPHLERTGRMDLHELHTGLARVASLALLHGADHQQLLDAVRPDLRGAAAPAHLRDNTA